MIYNRQNYSGQISRMRRTPNLNVQILFTLAKTTNGCKNRFPPKLKNE